MISDYNLECLHIACNGFAPDAAAQKGFAEIRREMDKAGESVKRIAEALTSRLLDGLQYGNWPQWPTSPKS